MQVIPVVVPGIMGSTLSYDHLDGRNPLTLWSGDICANYERLIDSPGTLRWSGNPAKAELIENFSISAPFPILGAVMPLKKAVIWERALAWIRRHPAFDAPSLVSFGYDWRAPLAETAKEFAERLGQVSGDDVSTPWNPGKRKFCIFGHSMGGVVAMLALGQEALHPSRVDRLIVIGSPLKGAPSSFSAAYQVVDLPFFTEIFGLVRRKNMALFYKNLLECIRTFPSIYSLFPSEEIPYLYYGPSSRSNPLRENAMPDHYREICIETHRLIKNGVRLLDLEEVDAFAVYTEINSHRNTDLEYRVTPHAPGYGYSIDETTSSTLHGDGTVPSDSACGGGYFRRQTVVNVDHAFLCNDERVIECLTALIPQARSYAS
jgi:hypothetical protein